MFYVFHGNDSHSQQKQLANLQAKLGSPDTLSLNTTIFEGQVDIGELKQVCYAMPFLSDKRLVVVRGMFAKAPAKEMVKELVAFLPELPETTRLVFMEPDTLNVKHPLIKAANEAETGFVKQFNRPEGADLDRWVSRQVNDRGGSIEPRAANLLAISIGNELQIIDNEIEKLLLYKGEGTIGEADVALLCPYAAEANIFDLVDALGNRNGRAAAQLLHAKLSEGTDPFYLFAMVTRQFRLLIQVKELASKGKRAPEIGKSLRMHNFVAGKLFQQAQQFTLPQLERIYGHLLETDVGVKTGQTDMTTSLNLLVAGLTR